MVRCQVLEVLAVEVQVVLQVELEPHWPVPSMVPLMELVLPLVQEDPLVDIGSRALGYVVLPMRLHACTADMSSTSIEEPDEDVVPSLTRALHNR